MQKSRTCIITPNNRLISWNLKPVSIMGAGMVHIIKLKKALHEAHRKLEILCATESWWNELGG